MRVLMIHPRMAAAVRALLEAGSRDVVEVERLTAPESPRLFPAPVYVSPRDYGPPSDVRRLRRQQYARERRTRPQLSKGKGRR